MLRVAPIPLPDSTYQAPFGVIPADFQRDFSRLWVPELSPLETNGACDCSMSFSAAAAVLLDFILAGSFEGPIIMKSLYITTRRFNSLPWATYLFSRLGAWTSTTSASPFAAIASAWPVPTATVFTR